MNLVAELVDKAKSVELQRAGSAEQVPSTVVSWAILVAVIAGQKRSFVDEFGKDQRLDCWPVQHWHSLHFVPLQPLQI
jgi:hypothetical protein